MSLNQGICYIFTLKKYPNNVLTQPNQSRYRMKHVLRFVPCMDRQIAGHFIICGRRVKRFYLYLDVSFSLSAVLNHNKATMYIYSQRENSLYNLKQLHCAKGIRLFLCHRFLRIQLAVLQLAEHK